MRMSTKWTKHLQRNATFNQYDNICIPYIPCIFSYSFNFVRCFTHTAVLRFRDTCLSCVTNNEKVVRITADRTGTRSVQPFCAAQPHERLTKALHYCITGHQIASTNRDGTACFGYWLIRNRLCTNAPWLTINYVPSSCNTVTDDAFVSLPQP